MSLFLSSSNTIAAGASGAVFAIWGAELIFLWRHRGFFGESIRASLQTSLLVLVLNIFIGFSSPAIGIWAHLGGLAGGVILTWFMEPYFVLSNPPKVVDGRIYAFDLQPLQRRIPVLVAYGVGLLAFLFLTFLLRA